MIMVKRRKKGEGEGGRKGERNNDTSEEIRRRRGEGRKGIGRRGRGMTVIIR